MAGVARLFDGHILNKSHEEVDLYDQTFNGKIIGLYFSGQWCPPCRRFTPILTEFYNKYHQDRNLEIIFISSDSDKRSFGIYYEQMPWLTLDYDQREKKEELIDKFQISGIPALILLDADSGYILSKDARNQIQNRDKEGKDFPWNSKKNKTCILI